MIKNAKMQGARSAFHLPVRQAILRVASRRIRSDILSRRRDGESARGVLGCALQRRRMRGTLQMGVFQQPVFTSLVSDEEGLSVVFLPSLSSFSAHFR
jgi:hypothetical protein